MRLQAKWLLAAVLPLLATAPTVAQPNRVNLLAVLQQGVGKPLLLINSSVKKEIKLTDEQAEKFRRIIRETYEKNQDDRRKAIQETRDQVNKAIPEILNKEQAKRLEQIKIQVNGILSFKREDVQKKLKLTDKQKDEIGRIGDDLKKDIRKVIEDAAGGGVGQRIAALGKVPELKKEATRKAVAVLDDEQKKTWNEMTGAKFELKLDLLNRRGARP